MPSPNHGQLKTDQVIEYSRDNTNWVRAILVEHAPFTQKRGHVSDGWYVINLDSDGDWVKTDLTTGITPSLGGWVMTSCIREIDRENS